MKQEYHQMENWNPQMKKYKYLLKGQEESRVQEVTAKLLEKSKGMQARFN